jgi:zinc protease
VKADEVFAMADALYTDWKKAEDPFKKYPLVDHPPIKASKVVLVVKPQVQTFSAEAVWQGPSTVGPTVKATYAADLLTILMGEPSSKFQKAIVDSGLCVGAGLSWFTQKNVGPINLGFEAEPDAAKAKACTEAVLAELPKMKAPDYFSDEEMGNAVHVLEIAQVKEREKLSEFSHTVTFWWASAGLDYYTSYVDELKKVTRADLASYLDTFVLGKPFILGVLVSPQVQAAGISEAELGKWAGITAVPAGFHAPTKPTTKKEGSK